MSKIVLSELKVTTEDDWVPVKLDNDLCELAIEMATLQEKQSKERNLNDRAIFKDPALSYKHTLWSKRAEYAVYQWAGRRARVTNPGEFHDYPDVGQVNVRFIGDPTDGLMIQVRDQGNMPMVLVTSKDLSFSDQTLYLIGWGMTDLLRRHYYLINQFRENKNWGLIGRMEPHEQFVYPRSMLCPILTLSKTFVNFPYLLTSKE